MAGEERAQDEVKLLHVGNMQSDIQEEIFRILSFCQLAIDLVRTGICTMVSNCALLLTRG